MGGGAFNAGTLADIDSCVAHVGSAVNRGTISATSKPSIDEVKRWLIRAKQEIMEAHAFTFKRVFSYMDTTATEYRYALPADFGEGGGVIRDITNDERLVPLDSVAFDSIFVDVAGESSSTPDYYTIKDRELWLSSPAAGTYRLELEYDRTGDDSSADDVSYLPEIMRFKMCDYAIYRSFIAIENYNSAMAYKEDWKSGMGQSKQRDGKKRWAALGYKVRGYVV